MLNLLVNAIMPHYCCSCGAIGAVLCGHCKNDIVADLSAQCFSCLHVVGVRGAVCLECRVHYKKGWFVGLHRGALREMVGDYKFERMKAAGTTLAELLDESLPQLPQGTLVACVPTVRSHGRQRGYDHAVLIAKQFAKVRGMVYCNPLFRATNTQQRGVSRRERLRQAQQAFYAQAVKPVTYLLVDDVSTTGATLNYAAKALKEAGAKEVWVAVITREPLD